MANRRVWLSMNFFFCSFPHLTRLSYQLNGVHTEPKPGKYRLLPYTYVHELKSIFNFFNIKQTKLFGKNNSGCRCCCHFTLPSACSPLLLYTGDDIITILQYYNIITRYSFYDVMNLNESTFAFPFKWSTDRLSSIMSCYALARTQ